jgi:hypothetical protein
MQPIKFPMLNTCNATAASVVLTCTNFKMGSKLPEFSVIVESARANQYSTKAPSLFRRLIFYCHCSCHGRRPFSAPERLPRLCLPTPSHSVDHLCVRSGFMCIDPSEISVHHLIPQLEPENHGKYRGPLRGVVHPIYTSCYDSYV